MNTEEAVLTQRYSSASIGLHWAMAVLMVSVYALINVADLFPKGSAPRQMAKDWHFMLGLLVFCLVWLRIAARLLGTVPPINPVVPLWQEKVAKAVHLALYALMVGMPLLGWLVLSAKGSPIPFFGLELPALLAPDKALGRQIREFHELGGNLGYLLIGGHALAALFHHYVVRDNTLQRMGFKSRS